MAEPTSLEHDLRAIQGLNRRHSEAWLSSDVEAVMSLWSDDFTVLPPAGPIVRGRRANAEVLEQARERIRAFEPLEHVEDIEEIRIAGDYAFEWGTYRATSRPRAGGEPVSSGGKLLRILQRQQDGSWKMSRTIFTSDSPTREQR